MSTRNTKLASAAAGVAEGSAKMDIMLDIETHAAPGVPKGENHG